VPADPPLICGKDAPQIGPPHPSDPIMRRPNADLEEKREPRVTGEQKRKTAGSTRGSGQGLTLAAIEKPALSLVGGNHSSCPFLVIRLCDALLLLNHSPSNDMEDVPAPPDRVRVWPTTAKRDPAAKGIGMQRGTEHSQDSTRRAVSVGRERA
jgi:hypothetical protein